MSNEDYKQGYRDGYRDAQKDVSQPTPGAIWVIPNSQQPPRCKACGLDYTNYACFSSACPHIPRVTLF